MTRPDVSTKHDYPSIPLAYDFVLPSYQWAMERSNVMEERIQAGLVGISAVTLALPTIAIALVRTLNPVSVWFFLALVFYVGAAVFGIYGRALGDFQVVNPKILLKDWVNKAPEKFMSDLIYFAGEDLEEHVRVIDERHRKMLWMYGFATLEIVAWVMWVSFA